MNAVLWGTEQSGLPGHTVRAVEVSCGVGQVRGVDRVYKKEKEGAFAIQSVKIIWYSTVA